MNKSTLLIGVVLLGIILADIIDEHVPAKCGDDEDAHACVPYHTCDTETKTVISSTDYKGNASLDFKENYNKCLHYLDVCCKLPSEGSIPSETVTLEPAVDATPTCGSGNPSGIDFKIDEKYIDKAEYGEFPWMLEILNKDYNSTDSSQLLAVCGASLIAPNIALTAAHCVYKLKGDEIKVRAGEWDPQTEKERYPFQERDVKEIIVHEDFVSKMLFNDVALLVLTKHFDKAPHIGTVCLPSHDQISNSTECFVSGWNKHLFGREGGYEAILRKARYSIIQHSSCEEALRKTRLGIKFKLHESFLCANLSPEDDTCEIYGGSPLVCTSNNNPKSYLQVGIVAWSLGCTDVPKAFVHIEHLRGWIDQQLERMNVNVELYTI